MADIIINPNNVQVTKIPPGPEPEDVHFDRFSHDPGFKMRTGREFRVQYFSKIGQNKSLQHVLREKMARAERLAAGKNTL